MNLQSHITISPEVLARDIGQETVLLHLSNGTYFGLDRMGARIWSLLPTKSTPQAICEALASEFDAEAAQIEQDVRSFLGDLEEQGLIMFSPVRP